jgi:hypothetical protein
MSVGVSDGSCRLCARESSHRHPESQVCNAKLEKNDFGEKVTSVKMLTAESTVGKRMRGVSDKGRVRTRVKG